MEPESRLYCRVHKICAQGTPSIVACDLGGGECQLQKNVYKLLPFNAFRCEKLRIAV